MTEKESIARKIKDGSYFTDAMDWYMRKYVHPIYERSILILFSVTALFALVVIGSMVKQKAEFETHTPFPIYVENPTDYLTTMHAISGKDEEPQQAVAKYLISNYVKLRESYIFADMYGDKYRQIQKNLRAISAKNVLTEYENYMSEANPYGPFARYKDHTNRTVEIKSIKFADNDESSGRATVIFEATETDLSGQQKKDSWQIDLQFRLPDIIAIAKTGAPLRFLVLYYRVIPAK